MDLIVILSILIVSLIGIGLLIVIPPLRILVTVLATSSIILGTFLLGIIGGILNGLAELKDSAIESGTDSYQEVKERKIELVVVILIFVAFGVANGYIQPKLMLYTDFMNECSIIQIEQLTSSFLYYVIRTPTEYILPRLNDVVLYLKGCYDSFRSDLELIFDILSVDGVTEVIDRSWTWIKCNISSLVNVQSIQIPYFTDLLSRLLNFLYSILDGIIFTLTGIVRLDFMATDCKMCDLSTELDGGDCPFMTTGSCGTGCHHYEQDICNTTMNVLDFITASTISSYFDGLKDPCTGLLETWKRPLFYILGWSYDCIPSDATSIFNDIFAMATEIIMYLGRLLNALSNGVIGDFIEFILQFIFAAFNEVVAGMEHLLNCFAAPTLTQCFNRFPDGNGPGKCTYDSHNSVIGGVETCFAQLATCAADPNFPFTHTLFVISGYNTFNALTSASSIIDDVVCPVDKFVGCMTGVDSCISQGGTGLYKLQCIIGGNGYGFKCTKNIPGFGGASDGMISLLDFFSQVYNDFQTLSKQVQDIVNITIKGVLDSIAVLKDGVSQINGTIQLINASIIQFGGEINSLFNDIFGPNGIKQIADAAYTAAAYFSGVFNCFQDTCYREAAVNGLGGPSSECNIIEYAGCFPGCFADTDSCSGSNTPDLDRRKRRMEERNINDTKTPEEVITENWLTLMSDLNVTNSTICGKTLLSLPIQLISEDHWGNYMSYMSCFITLTTLHHINNSEISYIIQNFTDKELLNPLYIPQIYISWYFNVLQKLSDEGKIRLSNITQTLLNITNYSQKRKSVTSENRIFDDLVYRDEDLKRPAEIIDNFMIFVNESKGGIERLIDSSESLIRSLIKRYNNSVFYEKRIFVEEEMKKRSIDNDNTSESIGTGFIASKWELGTFFTSFFKNMSLNNFFLNKTLELISQNKIINEYYKERSSILFDKKSGNVVISIAGNYTNNENATQITLKPTYNALATTDEVTLLHFQKDIEQMDLFFKYANEILMEYYRVNKFQSKLKDYRVGGSLIDKLYQMRSMRYNELTPERLLSQREYIEEKNRQVNETIEKIKNYTNSSRKVVELLYDRYAIDKNPWYKRLHILSYLIASNDTNKFYKFSKWMRGDLNYNITTGFVEIDSNSINDVNQDLIERDYYDSIRGPIYDAITFTSISSSNFKPKSFYIFMNEIPEGDLANPSYFESLFQNMSRSVNGILNKQGHIEPNSNRMKILADNSDGVDFNLEFFKIIDYVVSLFSKESVTYTADKYLHIIEYWLEWDIERFFKNVTNDFVEKAHVCHVPAQLNGTELWGPACIPFSDQTVMNWIRRVDDPSSFIYMQIPWPHDIIKQNCTNEFNGNSDLFEFEFSNNCDNNDGFERPECPYCDWCPKEYYTCKEKGFSDFIDNSIYILAALPFYINSITQPNSGISIFTLRYIILGISTIPIIFFILPALATIPLGLVITWLLYLFFGYSIPFGFLISVLFIILAILLPSALSFLPTVTAGVVVIIIAWGLSYFVTIPALTISIPREIYKGIVILDEFLRKWWININFAPLENRLLRFDYTGLADIPTVDKFCFGWTAGNLALFYLIAVFAKPLFTLASGIVMSIGLVLQGFVNSVIQFFGILNVLRLQGLHAASQTALTSFKTELNKLETQFKKEQLQVKNQIDDLARQLESILQSNNIRIETNTIHYRLPRSLQSNNNINK